MIEINYNVRKNNQVLKKKITNSVMGSSKNPKANEELVNKFKTSTKSILKEQGLIIKRLEEQVGQLSQIKETMRKFDIKAVTTRSGLVTTSPTMLAQKTMTNKNFDPQFMTCQTNDVHTEEVIDEIVAPKAQELLKPKPMVEKY